MAKTVAETIKNITKKHIDDNKGIVIGQCLTAVGWVQNTIPPRKKGTIELPMTDIAGAGIAVGSSLIGGRPIFVIRFQSLLWLNASPIVNYAAKAKKLFGYSAPIFIRAIASEGGGQGPIHTGSYHSMFLSVPDLYICSPMTPKEYQKIWMEFMKKDDPFLVSEHRRSYKSSQELKDILSFSKPDITLFGISSSRFECIEVVNILKKKGIKINFINILWLKPLRFNKTQLNSIRNSKIGLVVDSSYEIGGAARSIAYDLSNLSQKKIYALGVEDKIPGAAIRLENGTPTKKIISSTIVRILKKTN